MTYFLPTPQLLAECSHGTYRIVTDGERLFLLPYCSWLLPPYAHCHWLQYDEREHGHLPVVQRLEAMRGDKYVETISSSQTGGTGLHARPSL